MKPPSGGFSFSINFVIMQTSNITMLPVMEHFYTIQGEGFHSGRAAYFIRLAGCDIECVWCDVKESWDANQYQNYPAKEIAQFCDTAKSDFVVITGGEPCMYSLEELTQQLHHKGKYIAIETSGCYPITGEIDWICFSPKKFKSPLESVYKQADELKIIIAHPSDFEWAENHAQKVNDNCKLYLQAEWSKRERFLPLIVEHVKNHPKWNISIQTHKILNIP